MRGITVDRSIGEPLADQIARQVRDLVDDGSWPPHYRLPSEPALAQQLGVNRGTVRRALATLAEERLLTTVRGRGTFVASRAVEPLLEGRLRSLSEDFAAQGVRQKLLPDFRRFAQHDLKHTRRQLGLSDTFGKGQGAERR